MKLYFDATDAVLGRLGSVVCKELLKGKEVVIINCEKAIISGNRQTTLADILHWRNLGGKGLKGPRVSKTPERLLKRMIRGMLPWNRTGGREAYARLICHTGTGNLKPEELKNIQKIGIRKPIKYITLEEVSKSL